MNITNSPNLKPWNDHDEHDVINGFFSANVASLNKGSYVSLVAGASGNTNVWQNGVSGVFNPLLGVAAAYGGGPSRVTSYRSTVKWKVAPSASGEIPLGISLYDVRETTARGESYLALDREIRIRDEVALSGEAIPIATKGFFLMKGFVGTPAPGSGINNSIAGSGVVGPYTKGTSFARILSGPDADGYAFVKVEL